MTNPQTEARAIARKRFDELPQFWQGYIEQMVEDHATALAEKNAELAAERAALRLAADRADRAEAQLAEANKALDLLLDYQQCVTTKAKPDDAREWRKRIAFARRAREQGGENG